MMLSSTLPIYFTDLVNREMCPAMLFFFFLMDPPPPETSPLPHPAPLPIWRGGGPGPLLGFRPPGCGRRGGEAEDPLGGALSARRGGVGARHARWAPRGVGAHGGPRRRL